MSASKRPSTSSLRRFISSRAYVTVAELRRRFGLDDPDAMTRLRRNGTLAWVGLPEREGAKLQELWHRDELGLELSVEVHAPVVVGIYPMRIARYLVDGFQVGAGNGTGNGHAELRPNRPAGNGTGPGKAEGTVNPASPTPPPERVAAHGGRPDEPLG
jgi:hypothetical protein